jgi:hypothetical protein
MGKWTPKTKRNAKTKKKITWWKRELVRSKEVLAVDRANPRYISRHRDGGGIESQEARIKSIKVVIEKLESSL